MAIKLPTYTAKANLPSGLSMPKATAQQMGDIGQGLQGLAKGVGQYADVMAKRQKDKMEQQLVDLELQFEKDFLEFNRREEALDKTKKTDEQWAENRRKGVNDFIDSYQSKQTKKNVNPYMQQQLSNRFKKKKLEANYAMNDYTSKMKSAYQGKVYSEAEKLFTHTAREAFLSKGLAGVQASIEDFKRKAKALYPTHVDKDGNMSVYLQAQFNATLAKTGEDTIAYAISQEQFGKAEEMLGYMKKNNMLSAESVTAFTATIDTEKENVNIRDISNQYFVQYGKNKQSLESIYRDIESIEDTGMRNKIFAAFDGRVKRAEFVENKRRTIARRDAITDIYNLYSDGGSVASMKAVVNRLENKDDRADLNFMVTQWARGMGKSGGQKSKEHKENMASFTQLADAYWDTHDLHNEEHVFNFEKMLFDAVSKTDGEGNHVGIIIDGKSFAIDRETYGKILDNYKKERKAQVKDDHGILKQVKAGFFKHFSRSDIYKAGGEQLYDAAMNQIYATANKYITGVGDARKNPQEAYEEAFKVAMKFRTNYKDDRKIKAPDSRAVRLGKAFEGDELVSFHPVFENIRQLVKSQGGDYENDNNIYALMALYIAGEKEDINIFVEEKPRTRGVRATSDWEESMAESFKRITSTKPVATDIKVKEWVLTQERREARAKKIISAWKSDIRAGKKNKYDIIAEFLKAQRSFRQKQKNIR